MSQSMQVLGKILLSIVMMFAISLIVGLPVFLLFAMFSGESIADIAIAAEHMEENIYLFLNMFISSIGLMGAALIMYALFERQKKWSLGWKQKRWVAEAMKGMVAGILFITVVAQLIGLLGGFAIVSVQFNADVLQSLIFWLIIFVLVAITEEVFTRGYIQGLVNHHFGTKIAIVVSSILFALMHSLNPAIFESPMPIINLFLAGVLLGISRHVTGGLWMPIGLHFTWNLFQGNVYGFHVSGIDVESIISIIPHDEVPLISGGAFGAEGSMITSIVLVVSSYLVYKYYTKR